MANLDQIISYLGDNHFSFETFDSPAMSITAGTIGTNFNSFNISIEKPKKKPLALWVATHSHPSNYNVSLRWNPTDNFARLQVYRATGAAVNAPAGDVTIAVLYIDDNQS